MRVAGWIGSACALLAAWPLRRRLGWIASAAALLVALALALAASGVLPEPPDPKKLVRDTAQALGSWTYLLVGLLAFLETGAFVGLVVPGETVVIVGGVIAGQGEIDLLALIGITWFAAVLGDSVSFFLGRRLGRPFALKHGPRLRITPARLAQVEAYFERHGGKTILIGRWIGIVRALAPFVAGSSRLPYRRFIPYSVIGTGVWSSFFCVLGFVFWHSFDQVASLASRATAAFGAVVALAVAAVVTFRLLRDPDRRAALAARLDQLEQHRLAGPPLRALRTLWQRVFAPLGALLGPRLRFLRDRLTPGDLGLELTTPLAIAGTGAYLVTLEASQVARDPGPTPLDRTVAELVERVRTPELVDVARFVTDLGATASVLALLVFAVTLLIAARRWSDAGAILAGAVLLFSSLQLLKHGIDRPRPDGGLVAVEGPSFPSGHAAYATAWAAVAVSAARALPALAHGAAVVLLGVAIAVAVGVTRVYLGVHYFSDVIAGWALGATAFAGVAALLVVVAHLRSRRAMRAPAPTHARGGTAADGRSRAAALSGSLTPGTASDAAGTDRAPSSGAPRGGR